MKIKLPLPLVKGVCIAAVFAGLFFAVTGNWIVGICMLLGSFLFEKNLYRCPHCGAPLDMKRPLLKGARCPACAAALREA